MIRVRIDRSAPVIAGVVWAESRSWKVPAGFEERLAAVVALRGAGVDEAADAVRLAARDMLRNGRYKPTGRGKPASEYLVRAAAEHTFPRINPVVDICNLVSLESLFPISLWDVDKAGAGRYLVRLGAEGESYVFNRAGQEIDLADLVVGCRMPDDRAPEPIVNPVKDSMATKTDDSTVRVAALVYAPVVTPEARLAALAADFASLLAACAEDGRSGWGTASHDAPYEP